MNERVADRQEIVYVADEIYLQRCTKPWMDPIELIHPIWIRHMIFALITLHKKSKNLKNVEEMNDVWTNVIGENVILRLVLIMIELMCQAAAAVAVVVDQLKWVSQEDHTKGGRFKES